MTLIERARAWANSIYSKCAPTDPVCAHLAEGPGIVKALLEELETQQAKLAETKTELDSAHFALATAGRIHRETKEQLERIKGKAEAAASIALNYRQVLDACPPCRVHGTGCVAHAVEWISTVVKEAG